MDSCNRSGTDSKVNLESALIMQSANHVEEDEHRQTQRFC